LELDIDRSNVFDGNLINHSRVINKNIEHIYFIQDYSYGSFSILTILKDFNFLFGAFILLIFSFYILNISASTWYKYKKYLWKNEINHSLDLIIIEKNSLLDRAEALPKEYFEKSLSQYDRDLQIKKTELGHMIKSETNVIWDNGIYIILGIFIFFIYFLLIFNIKGIPIDFLDYEIINYPLQFVPPLLVTAVLFSLIALIRFILIQGGNNDKKLNRFSFFGIILVFIDLTACFITIYQFTK
tara:strand:- start:1125 stop:1850 length:726 start_codon:yes stop_codon:yes gene_type:complete